MRPLPTPGCVHLGLGTNVCADCCGQIVLRTGEVLINSGNGFYYQTGIPSLSYAVSGGRWGQPADLVGACLFLLGDEASWITGQVLDVDGGQVFR